MYQLSRPELEELLHRAIAKAKQEQERNHPTTSDDIYARLLSPDISPEKEAPTLVDLVFPSLDELDPAVKKYLEQEFLARYYPVSEQKPSETNIVPLSTPEQKISEQDQSYHEFQNRIKPYHELFWENIISYPNSHWYSHPSKFKTNTRYETLVKKRETNICNLYSLADASILNKQDLNIYLNSLKTIEKLFGDKYFHDGYFRYNSGWKYLFIDSTKFKHKVLNHIEKYGKNINFDIAAALDYNQRLQNQLAHPQNINETELSDPLKIDENIKTAQNYLNESLLLLNTITKIRSSELLKFRT